MLIYPSINIVWGVVNRPDWLIGVNGIIGVIWGKLSDLVKRVECNRGNRGRLW